MNITVYCGSKMGNDEIYRQTAEIVGKWIVEKDHTLVYGGGSTGLMRVLAETVLNGGGKVIGVRPDFLSKREPMLEGLTEFIKVETMSERKKVMIDNGDVYIALPGGLGTMEEISEVVSWSTIGKNDNPCIFYNVRGFYNDVKNQYDTMEKLGFLSDEYKENVLFSDSMDEIITFIKNRKGQKTDL